MAANWSSSTLVKLLLKWSDGQKDPFMLRRTFLFYLDFSHYKNIAQESKCVLLINYKMNNVISTNSAWKKGKIIKVKVTKTLRCLSGAGKRKNSFALIMLPSPQRQQYWYWADYHTRMFFRLTLDIRDNSGTPYTLDLSPAGLCPSRRICDSKCCPTSTTERGLCLLLLSLRIVLTFYFLKLFYLYSGPRHS